MIGDKQVEAELMPEMSTPQASVAAVEEKKE
jgi:hypothetical protein